MGSPDFAVPALEALYQQGHEIIAVYSQPPKPKGRGQQLQPTPIHQWAQQHKVETYTPLSLKDEAEQARIAAFSPEIIVVAAYGLLLPKYLVEHYLCLNIHASLLPRWRGAAPIQRAIEAGDKETGIAIMRMEEGLDTGDVMLTKRADITEQTTGGSLHDTLADLGAEAVIEAMALIESSQAKFLPQQGEVVYAPKLKKEEAEIDWGLSAKEIERKIRAFNPWPGCYTSYEGERIKIFSAEIDGEGEFAEPGSILKESWIACGRGRLRPKLLQKQGKKAMALEEFLRGFELVEGRKLVARGLF